MPFYDIPYQREKGCNHTLSHMSYFSQQFQTLDYKHRVK